MRKDAGLNSDLDRIPQLAWLLFLKAFDDLEERRQITERNYRAVIDEPFRWRDWAADPERGLTGDDLITLVEGKLLVYLRELSGTGNRDPRDTLAAVFKETHNRMLSGYLLRDVVDAVNKVNFASADDIHTMAHLYESMLREMRDAAGANGEFYTPRPVIRFIVQQVAPEPGERILDPACGTGGFLVEALEHLRPDTRSIQKWRALHKHLRGVEKKPMPYLLGMMNMLLHEVEQPNITRGNALSRPLIDIGKRDRVNVILTNPPFGGEEEKVIQTNFPTASRTAETSLLFVQLIQRMLDEQGRCGMVVPNGFLFGDGVAARVKENLLRECNLHTIVRLPAGVFAPYTDIPTNLLFFEKTGRTKEVWFYEIPAPGGRKKYSKTKPMRSEEFDSCARWWGGAQRRGRRENGYAWRVPIGNIEIDNWNLDSKNPHSPQDLSHRPPEELIHELISTEQEILTLLESLESELPHNP